MATKKEDVTTRESAATDLTGSQTQVGPPVHIESSLAGVLSGPNLVLVELMRKVLPLATGDPEAILRFVCRLNEIHVLGLSDDRSFIVRLLPLVSGAMLRFFGDCLRSSRTWEQCKRELLREFFPHFVRERMVHDLITFNFHPKTQSVREYIDQVFTAAEFLGYEVGEQQLVDRILMNLHPSILAHTAFLDRPKSRNGLYDEEKVAALKERQRTLNGGDPSGNSEVPHPQSSRNTPANPRTLKCWNCSRPGHLSRNCRKGAAAPGNGQAPSGLRTTGREH